MQVEAPASEVARRSGLDDGQPDQHRQDRRAGPQEEEAHIDRGVGEGCARAALPQAAEAFSAGDNFARRQSAAGEGGGARVVLQQATEGEAHDAPEHAGRRDDGGYGARALRARRRARVPAAARAALSARAVAAARTAAGRAHARSALTVRPVGAAAAVLRGAALAAPAARPTGPRPTDTLLVHTYI